MPVARDRNEVDLHARIYDSIRARASRAKEGPIELPTGQLIERLLFAAGFGALLGFEREWEQKAAGLRTNILIAIGSALFTTMSIELAAGPNADPGRIAAQIVTGIGFLGAGAIIRTGAQVRGLTTAATIWMNAAVGVAAGGGQIRLAGIATIITFIVLRVLVPIEKLIERREVRRLRLRGGAPSE